MKTNTVYEHNDLLGQPITVGAYVAFTWSQNRGVRVGNITKLTEKRVRIAFTSSWERNGERHEWSCNHISRPDDVIILGDGLPKHLTLATLQKKI